MYISVYIHFFLYMYALYRLLLYGVCCSLDERFAEADEMMELATTIDTGNIIAWTVRGNKYTHSAIDYKVIEFRAYEVIHEITLCAYVHIPQVHVNMCSTSGVVLVCQL